MREPERRITWIVKSTSTAAARLRWSFGELEVYEMGVWWSAIDLEHSSYEELKHRKVIAQGWNALGDIRLLRVFLPDLRDDFVSVIQLIGDAAYRNQSWWAERDRDPSRTPSVMWNLLNVAAGDLVVAVEGTKVRGLCEVIKAAVESYTYQGEWDYAQTIGFPATWIDWNPQILGTPPTAPSHSVLGIRSLQKEEHLVREAWANASRSP